MKTALIISLLSIILLFSIFIFATNNEYRLTITDDIGQLLSYETITKPTITISKIKTDECLLTIIGKFKPTYHMNLLVAIDKFNDTHWLISNTNKYLIISKE